LSTSTQARPLEDTRDVSAGSPGDAQEVRDALHAPVLESQSRYLARESLRGATGLAGDGGARTVAM